ncbi:MAG TPA: antitoxin Xre-like helix-turn-helix domain-containing protein [Gemmatimonadaceae bacterium]|nr:antitoxin Xre-like helix-turn-helix domain-containing protein [Gemmatimonadaceae bacterium]
MPTLAQRKLRGPAPISEPTQAGAGLRTFARIAALWKLSAADAMSLLGVDSRSSYYDLLKRAREARQVNGLSRDQLDRLSYLLGIYESIRTLFPHSEETRNAWISRPNTAPLFTGRAPLDVMRASMIGLYQTFAHLAAARA